MLAIRNNIMAESAARNLGKSYDALATSIERLSSGLRINSAKDDAAGLAVVLGGPERNVVAKQLLAELGVGKPANSEQMGREGYTLVVTQRANGRVAAILAGISPAGDFWALQTLKQLLVAADGKRYIAGVWMVDWPSFPSRGSKGGRNYQPQYL